MFTSASNEKREIRPRNRALIRGWVMPHLSAAAACVQPASWISEAIFRIKTARTLRLAASSALAVALEADDGRVT
jgi:hypothetical protein